MAPVVTSPLHLLGCFSHPFVGAERELPELAMSMAGRRPTHVWSTVPPHRGFKGMWGQKIRHLRPYTAEVPVGGMLLFGGIHVSRGIWLKHARPERVALRYNFPNHTLLFEAINEIREATGLDPELLFASAGLQMGVGLPGRIEPSFIRLESYLGIPVQRPVGRPFTIGRVSRDTPEKHNPHDPALYRMLAARGWRVRLMGATCLADQLAGVDGVEVLPAGAEPVPAFYASLDACFYRTGDFAEPYARVVWEAMASGLPLVALATGGYAQFMGDGVNAFLVRSQEQAFDCLDRLQRDVELRYAMAEAGRRLAVSLHGQAAIDEALKFYLT